MKCTSCSDPSFSKHTVLAKTETKMSGIMYEKREREREGKLALENLLKSLRKQSLKVSV